MDNSGTATGSTVMAHRDSVPGVRFLLRIAGLVVEVTCDETILNVGVQGSRQKFIVREGVPDVRISVVRGALSEASMGRKVFDAGPAWQLYQYNGSYLFTFKSVDFGPRPYEIAVFNQDFSKGEIYLHPDFLEAGQPVDPLWPPLDELLYSNLLARGRGAEVHGCGLVDPEGQGHLFLGRSGAGKTTMAHLWEDIPGVSILSDDRIILRKIDGRIWMFGTPWHGLGGQALPKESPLSRIYFLRKAENNKLLPMKEAEAATRLTAFSFPPFYNREAMDFTLGFLGEVAHEVPCCELSVVPDKRVVEFIRTGLRTEFKENK